MMNGSRTRHAAISSRRLFCVHAFVVTCLVVGIAIRIPLDPNYFVPPLLPPSVLLPPIVLVMAIIEKRTPGKILAIVMPSAALNFVFYAVLPMVS